MVRAAILLAAYWFSVGDLGGWRAFGVFVHITAVLGRVQERRVET
jgi:hypothetical protein